MVVANTLPETVRYGHFAMATQFELFVPEDSAGDRAAIAAEVFREIDRLETELSRFREGSDVYRINHAKPGTRLHVTPDTFRCLQLASAASRRTRGAFDITYATTRPRNGLMREVLALDETELAVDIHAAHLKVDLGAIGKGYALDQAGSLLADWGLSRCLIHGGGSSILALDPPEAWPAWPVSVNADHSIIALKRQALGASGKEVQGEHIVDPRGGTPEPSCGTTQRTWVTAPQAALADALSTAFMVLSPAEALACCMEDRNLGACLQCHVREVSRTLRFGSWPDAWTGDTATG